MDGSNNENSDDSDYEIVFQIVKNGFPIPCDDDDLVKQENEDISGDLAFKKLVRVFFFQLVVCLFVNFMCIFQN